MVKITLLLMAMLQTSSAAILIQGEDGSSTLIEDPNLVSGEQPATGSKYSIEQCFISACQTSTAKNFLVGACKKGGYSSCDSLYYHATYYKDHNGHPTFKNLGNVFRYGTTTTTYSQENVASVRWNNSLSTQQQQIFEKDIQKTTSQSWSNTVETKVSDSITVKETAGLPGIVQEQLSETFQMELDTSKTTAQSKSTTQTWKESQVINIPAHTCVDGCMIERDGNVVAPYTFSGHITGTWSSDGKSIYAAQCCYLRPGGSSDCSGLGSKTGAAGWQLTATADYFVSTGTSAGKEQCKGFTVSGNDAVFSGAGKYTGGVGFNVSIATVECGTACKA